MGKCAYPADAGVWDRIEGIITPAVIIRGEAADRGRALEAAVADIEAGVSEMVVLLAEIAGRTDVPADLRKLCGFLLSGEQGVPRA